MLFTMTKKEIGRVPLHNLEGIVSFGYRGTSPALMGACADKKYFPLLFDTSGKVSGKDYRKNKRKCHIKGTTVFKL